MNRAVIALVTLCMLCLGPRAALAQDEDTVVAPPGNSAVDEYLEVVPGAGGNRPAQGEGSAAGSQGDDDRTPSARETLGAKTARSLNALGADGRATAAIAAAGVPAAGHASGGDGNAGAPAALAEPDAATVDAGGARAEAVAGALVGKGGGMGLAFPLVLGGALAGAMGLLAMRRLARRT